MSRIIEFRGFEEHTAEWVYGDLKHGSNNFVSVSGRYVMAKSVGQFTGLLDKNGVKIFEGDIIRVCKNKNGAFVVTFKNQYVGGWVLEHSKGELSLGARKQDEIEIIGNVFEHPELINDFGV